MTAVISLKKIYQMKWHIALYIGDEEPYLILCCDNPYEVTRNFLAPIETCIELRDVQITVSISKITMDEKVPEREEVDFQTFPQFNAQDVITWIEDSVERIKADERD